MKKSIIITISSFYLLIAISSQVNAQTHLFSHEKFVAQNGDSLNYRSLLTDYAPNQKYPLVIFLHGSGERGNDNEAQLKWGVLNFAKSEVMKNHPAIIIAPQCPPELMWDNLTEEDKLNPSPSKPMKLLKALIDETIKNMPVDTNRIYITGLSMGGFGTFDAITRYPKLFAAAAPVCGGGDISKAAEIAHIPMWIFHGAIDESVTPDYSQNMFNELIKNGAKPGFTQYPEVGHFAWITAYSDPMMIEWLFRQKKTLTH